MALIGIVFFALMLLGAPIAFAIGISGFTFFLTSDIMPVSIGVQKIATVSQSFPLLAVPFFVLAGHLMNESGITDRLFTFSKVAVGWMAGGLAQVSIILSTLMGGVSGSAVADAAMEARVLGPQMISNGYSKGYSSAVIAISSLITFVAPLSLKRGSYVFPPALPVKSRTSEPPSLLKFNISLSVALFIPILCSINISSRSFFPQLFFWISNENDTTLKERNSGNFGEGLPESCSQVQDTPEDGSYPSSREDGKGG